MINVAINGANGNMGKTLQQTLAGVSDINLVCCLDQDDNLAQSIRDYHPDVVVDFTHPHILSGFEGFYT